MKNILLTIILLGIFEITGYAQGKGFADGLTDGLESGAQQALEAQRLRNETALTKQQVELIKQQIDSMKKSNSEYTNELFLKGYQEGFSNGYKKGADSITETIEKQGILEQMKIVNSIGEKIFKETSINDLTEAKDILTKNLNTPNHYVAKVYIALIDTRLNELKQNSN
jgi:hypothetical protein